MKYVIAIILMCLVLGCTNDTNPIEVTVRSSALHKDVASQVSLWKNSHSETIAINLTSYLITLGTDRKPLTLVGVFDSCVVFNFTMLDQQHLLVISPCNTELVIINTVFPDGDEYSGKWIRIQ
jgi:hypothetical protein